MTSITPRVLLRGRWQPWVLAVVAGLSFISAQSKPDSQNGEHAIQDTSKDTTLSEVTIRAQREALERQLRAYVASAIREPFDESLVRWNRPICFLVVGLSREEGEFVRARLSHIAVVAGAQLAPQPCQANFAVVMTAEPNTVLKAWFTRDYHLFGDAAWQTIDQFLKTPRPVRVWYNIKSEIANGLPGAIQIPGLIGKGPTDLPVNPSAEGTRIVFNGVRAFSSVIVTFDNNRTKGLNLDQLADYAAMVGLAEIQTDAAVENTPTILRLFSTSAEPVPTGLSAWDTALLEGLYNTDQRWKVQRSRILQSMLRDIAP